MNSPLMTTFVTLSSLFVLARSANSIIPMRDFEPGKIHGVWYGWKRTAGLFDLDTSCALAHFLHKTGDAYRTTFVYLFGDEVTKHMMDITDNTAEKAQFVFENDVHTVALTILDTDYENYMILYGHLGSKTEGVYYFGGRKQDIIESLQGKLDAAIKTNEITFPFSDVRQTNCPNMTAGSNLDNAKEA